MEHADHVALLRGGIPEAVPGRPAPVWADLGSGAGAFTLALADLLGPGAMIFSLDRDQHALDSQQRAMAARFPDTHVSYIVADFTRPLALPPIDGVVMANSLHFVRAKEPVLDQIRRGLRPGGRLILVEYDTDRGNHWVPYPLAYGTWARVAAHAGFRDTRLLMRRPSRFLGAIYAALSISGSVSSQQSAVGSEMREVPRPSSLPPTDAKALVATGYDRIADTYAEWAATVRVAERAKYTRLILDTLPTGAAVLELGCGSGLPTTRALAERFAVTGVDLSARQIARARANVPNATFIQADMTALDFPPGSFDAVVAFYALTHVPREEHATLLAMIAAWLRPGGLFVAAMGAHGTTGDVEDDWLGAPMYFSHFDAATNRALVAGAGLTLISAQEETADEFGRPMTFLWIVARKS